MLIGPRAARQGSILAVLALSTLLLASAMAGSVFVPADSLNIVAPYWWSALVLALAVTALLARRSRAPALLLLAGHAGAGAVLFSPILSAKAGSPAQPSARIVTFNMHRANPRALEATRWILRQDADFVVLLEAAPNHYRAIEMLKQRLPYVYGCAARGYCSTLVFARQPANDVWPLAHGDADNRRALSAVTARFAIAGGILPITAVHLQHPWPLGRQADQLDQLAIALATIGRRGIATGDFNAAPWTFAMRRLAAAGELQLVSGAAGTWPARNAPLLRLPLDQVYIGQCLSVAEVRRGPPLGSDHLPIVSDITFDACHG